MIWPVGLEGSEEGVLVMEIAGRQYVSFDDQRPVLMCGAADGGEEIVHTRGFVVISRRFPAAHFKTVNLPSGFFPLPPRRMACRIFFFQARLRSELCWQHC